MFVKLIFSFNFIIIYRVSTTIIQSLVLFDPLIWAFQVLSFQARVDLGVMAMKEYSSFPKAAALLTIIEFSVRNRTLIGVGKS